MGQSTSTSSPVIPQAASSAESCVVTHIIFDFDGVLVDSEEAYSKMHERLLAKYGKKFDLTQKLAIQGMRKDDEVETILKLNGLLGKVTADEYKHAYTAMYGEMLTDVEALPGANDLIHHFCKHKVPMAICTSSAADEFEVKTAKHYKHWLDMVPIRVLAGSDPSIKNGKPAPDPYLATLKKFPVLPKSPQNVLVFEDSVNGCKSALDAGMKCIMVPQKKFSCPATQTEIEGLGPRLTDILPSLAAFRPERYALPALDA